MRAERNKAMIYDYRLENINPQETAEIKRQMDEDAANQKKRQEDLEKKLNERPAQKPVDSLNAKSFQ
jgi:hypothetical protein